MLRSRQLPGTWYYSSNHVILNQARASRTIAPLTRLRKLDELARSHAESMAAKGKVFASDAQELHLSLGDQKSRRLGENVARGESIRGKSTML
jgi:uncharacterized protein YkwD